MFPKLTPAMKVNSNCIFLGASGFEDRQTGWAVNQQKFGSKLAAAYVVQYVHAKGANRIDELSDALRCLGVRTLHKVPYDVVSPHKIEDDLEKRIEKFDSDEVVVDISAMTKLLILAILRKLESYRGTVRLVYSEAKTYAPTKREYEKHRYRMGVIAKFPSRGAESIIRLKCLSSIRMQGQPVTLVAFTSFNEQLVRHMLGTISPHRLLFINGRPPRGDYLWREAATQEIHSKRIDEYSADNPLDGHGLLRRSVSTLYYEETIKCIQNVYSELGGYERIICAATGSKMQTVGLAFCKMLYPDIHIEYPTPDSYFVSGLSKGVQKVWEVVMPNYKDFTSRFRINRTIAI